MNLPASPLRIAILTHSTNPRGGVVHALEVADALVRLGHDAVVHAPDPKRAGFFRPTLCRTVSVQASPVGQDVTEMVEIRAADYVRHFHDPANRDFDLFHAQDGISGNALATLRQCGLIAGFARTVHHVDVFHDPRLVALQARAITSADRLLVVSRTWRDALLGDFNREAAIVGNGVDTARFSAARDGSEPGLRSRLGLREGPVFLSIGGVEERKNTLRILDAFCQIFALRPTAQLVIAGGASVLDHSLYQARFAAALAASRLPDDALVRTGPLPQGEMTMLYRLADALVFPSVKEGFGLTVLEAMASGLPVVTSRIAPFTENLEAGDALWCDPSSPPSIANAMAAALSAPIRDRLITRGLSVAARHDWTKTALAHLPVYNSLRELCDA
jgi:glycosyltransferase-like protein